MNGTPATVSTAQQPTAIAGNLRAQVHETHTGVVILLGDKAFKVKKPVTTDFLDFSTPERREAACEHEVALNKRLAPDGYFGVGRFTGPGHGAAEPVIVMRRYPDSARLSTLIERGEPVHDHLRAIAEILARFHADTARGPSVDSHGTAEAVAARWQQNIVELKHYVGEVISGESIEEVQRLAARFSAGRSALFTQRIAERRILDGHADLLADDIFCMPEGPALLDCIEFDDHLRYVDGIDDAAFLAMDLEFKGRADLAGFFLAEYRRRADDPAPQSLIDFYVAYRAIVRAKVDCVRYSQGHPAAAVDAQRHIEIALAHLRSCTVLLVVVGGGPGTGKTTLSHALAESIGAHVLSTDDVRRELQRAGLITGQAGDLNAGLYAPANVAAVYDEVLSRAGRLVRNGSSVILDGTWRDAEQRDKARRLAAEWAVPMVELMCSVPLDAASARIERRFGSSSDATPGIAAALRPESFEGHRIDTGRPLADSVAEAQQVCRLAV